MSRFSINIIILVSFLLQVGNSKQINGSILQSALNSVLNNIKPVALSSLAHRQSLSSSIKRRCADKLACEYHVPVIEADNVVFKNGQVYLSRLDEKSQAAADGLSKLFASKPGHFPSSMTQITQEKSDWIPGPKINIVNTTFESMCPSDKILETSAYFLFPWETNNAFHSLNDNVFAVLASVILQYITVSDSDINILSPLRRTLYVFNKIAAPHDQSLVYKLLHIIFEGDVQPAGTVLLSKDPVCIRHVTWGTTIKVFYRDSLMDLRRVTYEVFHEILRLHLLKQSKSTAINANNGVDSIVNKIFGVTNTKNTAVTTNNNPATSSGSIRKPKVVIITRNSTKPLDSPARKISEQSEALIVSTLREQYGIDASICCDYHKVVNTVEKLVDHYYYVDICIGMHGAGMSNCALGAPGMVMVEFQNQHAYGFDSFMKIAHSARGQYVFYDVRDNPKVSGSGAGSVLGKDVVDNMLQLVLGLWRYSITQLDQPLLASIKSNSTEIKSIGRRQLVTSKKKNIMVPASNKNKKSGKTAVAVSNNNKQPQHAAEPVQVQQMYNKDNAQSSIQSTQSTALTKSKSDSSTVTNRPTVKPTTRTKPTSGSGSSGSSSSNSNSKSMQQSNRLTTTSDKKVPAWQSKMTDTYNTRKTDIAKSVYNGELVFDMKERILYMHPNAHSVECIAEIQSNIQQTIQSGVNKKTVNSVFKIEDMSLIQTNGMLVDVIPAVIFSNKQTSSVSGSTVEAVPTVGSNIIKLSGGQTFWVMLNPYTHEYTVESILGPTLEDNYNHCVTLPYYKFRTMTQPFKEHRGECDKRVIFTKRSGTNDNKLLTDFVK